MLLLDSDRDMTTDDRGMSMRMGLVLVRPMKKSVTCLGYVFTGACESMIQSVTSLMFAVILAVYPISNACGQPQVMVDTLRGARAIPYFDQPIDPDLYLVRPGEHLNVIFINARMSPRNLIVDAEGKLIDRNLGVYDVSYLTLNQVRQLLEEPLSRQFNIDEIVVSVGAIYPVSVVVTGCVEHPGRYWGFTSQTVADMIDSAGGLTADGSRRRIIFSGGPQPLNVDLERALYLGDYIANPCLYAGFRVEVPRQSKAAISITGEVNSPRTVEFCAGDNLELLIALAGGATYAAVEEAGYLVNDSSRSIHDTGNLQPGDVVMVPAVEATGLTIGGAVQSPGRYQCEAGMDVQRLVATAGGLFEGANIDRTTIFRKAEPDAVNQQPPGRYALLLPQDNLFSVVLRADDSVFIPFQVEYVKISGYVSRPGLYPCVEGRDVWFYIDLAGGAIESRGSVNVLVTDRVSGLTRHVTSGEAVLNGDEIKVTIREHGR